MEENDEPKPEIVEAYLDEKFKLVQGQKAIILDGRIMEARVLNEAMELQLQAFVFTACAENSNGTGQQIYAKKCDTRVVAQVSASQDQGNGTGVGTELSIREGEQAQFLGYNIRFADYYENGTGVFVVSKGIQNEIIKVKLDEKFGLGKGQIAIVVNEDVYIRMNSLSYAKSIPPQNPVANVSIWNSQGLYDTYDSVPTYDLRAGEEIEIYGVKIRFIGLDDTYNTGTFIVTKQGADEIINVHVDEKFKLAVNQAARVLEANMRLDLLNVNESVSCPAQRDSDTSVAPCMVYRTVEFSVNNYIYGIAEPGVKVDSATVSKTIISATQAEESSESSENSVAPSVAGSSSVGIRAVETVMLPEPLPPMPFNVYTLSEGESVEVNDFEIKVLSIGSDSAEFIVTEKSTGTIFNYVISSGWNLFSLPGKVEAGSSNCNTSEWSMYEYVKESNSFRKVTQPLPGKAYWIYNPAKSCEAKVTIRDALGVGDLEMLTPKWNFVAVVPEMVGKKITDLGDCELKAAFTYNATSRNWENVMDKEINNSYLGKAFAVYSNNECKLGSTSISPEPPPLPDLPGSCIDSDGGKLSGTKGSTTGLNPQTGAQQTIDDVCILNGSLSGSCSEGEDCKVVEYYCNGDYIGVLSMNCAKGCSNGACLAQGVLID